MKTIEAHLIESFILLNQFLQSHKIPYCLIGGVAAGYWGEPRYTKDIDFTVVSRTGDLKPLLHLFTESGFKILEKKGTSQFQVIQKDKLHFIADIILAEVEYQHWVIQRAQKIEMFEIEVPICTPEDLIILKLIANRRQDLLDIENVLKNCEYRLDLLYLQEWLSFWELNERFQKEFGKDYPNLLKKLKDKNG